MKPEFFRHELLQDLEITHAGKCPMLVFEGLFGHCDKAGRFLWRPKQLKLDILPFLPFDMAETLGILEQAGLVHRYTVNAVEYGEIPTFRKHQVIGGKESKLPERYPGPSGEVTVNGQGSDGERTVNERGLQELGTRKEEGKGSKALASSADALSAGKNGSAVAYIPINDGTEFGISAEQLSEWEKLFPSVDVPQTLNEIRAWNLAKPSRRKTRRGVLSHVVTWLSKEQNRGPQRR